MRAFVLSLAAIFICGTLALAQDAPKAPTGAAKSSVAKTSNAARAEHQKVVHGERHVLNNVVRMTADGKMTALCCCGKEFTVADNSPTMKHGDATFYLCSDACKAKMDKATPTQVDQTMSTWHRKYKGMKLTSNAVTKDGRKVATCLCGKTFNVTKATESISENGVVVYVCSDACAANMHNMSPADRLAKEKEIVANAPAPAPAKTAASPAK